MKSVSIVSLLAEFPFKCHTGNITLRTLIDRGPRRERVVPRFLHERKYQTTVRIKLIQSRTSFSCPLPGVLIGSVFNSLSEEISTFSNVYNLFVCLQRVASVIYNLPAGGNLLTEMVKHT